jgi:GDPmannose 4,6-dehydratase
MAVALVTGISGQDGYYLARHLHALGTDVWGLTRSGALPPDVDFAHPTPPADLSEESSLERAVAAAAPDEVYHLAAQSSVSVSWEDPVGTGNITGLGVARLLEVVRQNAPNARTFIVSSSEVFGEPESAPQNELTPIRPASPYGAAKAYAHHLSAVYRRQYDLFVAIGILYNHESPRRPSSFVTRKITRAAAAIARGEQEKLRLGNLEARRDWGFAGDHVRAMQLALAHSMPEDYIIATGETHSVRDWCELAFAHVGLDYRDHVVSDPELWRPAESVPLVGDSAKAKRLLHWEPSMSFPMLVKLMVESDLTQPSG